MVRHLSGNPTYQDLRPSSDVGMSLKVQRGWTSNIFENFKID